MWPEQHATHYHFLFRKERLALFYSQVEKECFFHLALSWGKEIDRTRASEKATAAAAPAAAANFRFQVSTEKKKKIQKLLKEP